MNARKQFKKCLFLLLGLLFLQSCASLMRQPVQPTQARLGEETQGTINLKSLPAPKDKIVVAVYKFRDQTGQYRPSENGTSWSTAVTQGATTILIKALEDSGWFVPIERENVSNLLNERKIIRSSRKQFNQGKGNGDVSLPALLYAGVIFEGGIISYDANVVTGGAGLRYFGAGGSNQYRQDRVTVYLRAVSTSNGKILKTVYTSKTILSQAMDAGIFRFVKFGRLLEAETGFTYNEPSELAVSEAIEKAVLSLIIEGIEGGLWQLEEPRQIVHRSILDYKKERKQIPQTDIFGRDLNNRRRKLSIDVGTANLLYKGDYPDPVLRTGVDLGITYSSSPSLGWSLQYGMSQLSTKDFYQSDISYLEGQGTYRFFPYDVFTPVATAGVGLITENRQSRFDFGNDFFPKAQFGLGFEYMMNGNVGLRATADYNYLFSDGFDEIKQGKYNDFYIRGNIGLRIYLGEKVESKRKFEYKREPKR